MTSKVIKIYGPPGTGKTTKLMGLLTQSIVEHKVDLGSVAFISLTHKAVNEAKERAAKALEEVGVIAKSEDMTYFSTMHSFTTKAAGVAASRIMGLEDYEAVRMRMAEWYPSYAKMKVAWMPGSNDLSKSSLTYRESAMGKENMDYCNDLKAIHLAEATGRDIGDIIREQHYVADRELFPSTYKRVMNLQRNVEGHKMMHNKVEFHDVIEEFHQFGFEMAPDFDIIFIDEAQDLSPAQWKCVARMAKKAKVMFIAGDPDQSIFRFNGADAKAFTGFPADKVEVLDKSYRIPNTHHALAMAMIRNQQDREDIAYLPNADNGEGEVHKVRSFDVSFELEFAVRDHTSGDVVLRTKDKDEAAAKAEELRNALVETEMQHWEEHEDGQVYRSGQLKHGMTLEGVRRTVYANMNKSVSVKPIADLSEEKRSAVSDIIDAIANDETVLIVCPITAPLQSVMDTFDRVGIDYAYGNNTNNDALVRISTVYKAKGGEADHVFVLDAISWSMTRNYQLHPEDIIRLYYVALTRGKKTLSICPVTGDGITSALDANNMLRTIQPLAGMKKKKDNPGGESAFWF